MLRAEINESGAAFINGYVLPTFIVEQARVNTIKNAHLVTLRPIASVHGIILTYGNAR